MIKSESNISKLIEMAISKTGTRIFRNNVGMGWIGESFRINRKKTVELNEGDVVVRNARPLHAGLIKGSSDLIGWKPITVTPDMVGKKIAIFTAVEVKTKIGRASKEQLIFIENVKKDGGISGIARTPAEAVSLIEK
jgi:hypothetical protein